MIWGENLIDGSMLIEQGYLKKGRVIESTNTGTIYAYHLTSKAQTLPAEQVQQSTLFISYSREESSALVLLVDARLKRYDLTTYIDVRDLRIGDVWHAELEAKIADHDNFIVLIGRKTLASKYVRQEIKWATEYNKNIYPIWHNKYKGSEKGIPSEDIEAMKVVTQITNAAIVKNENPADYAGALFSLLTKYGIII